MVSEKYCYGPDDVFDDRNIIWLNNDYRDQSLKESYLTICIILIFLIVLIYVYQFPLSGELNKYIWGISSSVIVLSIVFLVACYSTYFVAPIKIGFSNSHLYVIYRKKKTLIP